MQKGLPVRATIVIASDLTRSHRHTKHLHEALKHSAYAPVWLTGFTRSKRKSKIEMKLVMKEQAITDPKCLANCRQKG